MKRVLQLCFSLFFILYSLLVVAPQQTFAATVRGDETIILSNPKQELVNPYLFGETIQVASPVQGDVVSFGRTINLDGPVSGSTNVAGRDIVIKGTTQNSIRAAGGNIVIDGPVTNDVVVAGGNITITKNARIGGDVLFAGGTLKVEGPIEGKILFAGGEVMINTTVGKGIEGEVQKLTLGDQALINGDVKYRSMEQATISPGAQITGKTTFEEQKKQDKDAHDSFINGGVIYKLVIDILISLIFVFFLGKFVQKVIERVGKSPWKSGGIGFTFATLFPMACVIMLFLIWPGVLGILFYGFVLIISSFITQLTIGWFIMRWWEKRSKKIYHLDWKAAIIGPVVFCIAMFIPILGWLAAAILFFMVLGALIKEVIDFIQSQKIEGKANKKE